MNSRQLRCSRAATGVALVVGSFLAGGCRTIEGRYLGDMHHGQCVEGIPIRVEKPRYLALTYKTVVYGQRAGQRNVTLRGKEYVASGGYVITSTREEIETKIVTTGEVFAVDTKRPASGEITYGYQFEPGSQYPHTLSTKLTDSTVTDVVALAKALKENLTAESVSELQKRVDEAERAEQMLRGAGALVKLAEAVSRIEYYDLWLTDSQGFPSFAFQSEMSSDAKAMLVAPPAPSGQVAPRAVLPTKPPPAGPPPCAPPPPPEPGS